MQKIKESLQEAADKLQQFMENDSNLKNIEA